MSIDSHALTQLRTETSEAKKDLEQNLVRLFDEAIPPARNLKDVENLHLTSLKIAANVYAQAGAAYDQALMICRDTQKMSATATLSYGNNGVPEHVQETMFDIFDQGRSMLINGMKKAGFYVPELMNLLDADNFAELKQIDIELITKLKKASAMAYSAFSGICNIAETTLGTRTAKASDTEAVKKIVNEFNRNKQSAISNGITDNERHNLGAMSFVKGMLRVGNRDDSWIESGDLTTALSDTSGKLEDFAKSADNYIQLTEKLVREEALYSLRQQQEKKAQLKAAARAEEKAAAAARTVRATAAEPTKLQHDYTDIIPFKTPEAAWKKASKMLNGNVRKADSEEGRITTFLKDSISSLHTKMDANCPWQKDMAYAMLGDENIARLQAVIENRIKTGPAQNGGYTLAQDIPLPPALNTALLLEKHNDVLHKAVSEGTLGETLKGISELAGIMEKNGKYADALNQLTPEKLEHNLKLCTYLKDSPALPAFTFGPKKLSAKIADYLVTAGKSGEISGKALVTTCENMFRANERSASVLVA